MPNSTTITRMQRPPGPGDGFDAAVWSGIAPLAIASWHAKSSEHRPVVRLRLGHSGTRLHFAWSVDDRYVVSRETRTNAQVCRDSCVEAFFSPRPGEGYFNLEINAGGTVHLGFWKDPQNGEVIHPERIARHVRVASSLPQVVDPEIATPCRWTLSAEVDLALFSQHLATEVVADGRWTGNFYKCADRCSRPHWGSWNPLGAILNFHKPQDFAELRFEAAAQRTHQGGVS